MRNEEVTDPVEYNLTSLGGISTHKSPRHIPRDTGGDKVSFAGQNATVVGQGRGSGYGSVMAIDSLNRSFLVVADSLRSTGRVGRGRHAREQKSSNATWKLQKVASACEPKRGMVTFFGDETPP